MVLGNNKFKCVGRECNGFFGSFSHYVGARLVCSFFSLACSLFWSLCILLVYCRARLFFSNICFLNGFLPKKNIYKSPISREYLSNNELLVLRTSNKTHFTLQKLMPHVHLRCVLPLKTLRGLYALVHLVPFKTMIHADYSKRFSLVNYK